MQTKKQLAANKKVGERFSVGFTDAAEKLHIRCGRGLACIRMRRSGDEACVANEKKKKKKHKFMIVFFGQKPFWNHYYYCYYANGHAQLASEQLHFDWKTKRNTQTMLRPPHTYCNK